MKVRHPLALSLATLLTCGLGCKTAEVTSEHQLKPVAPAKPAVVHVTDFQLGCAGVATEPGVLSGRPGPVGRVGERLSGASEDPAVRARQVVELMANCLVKELSKSGFATVRLPPGAAMPVEGWLVRGVFAEIDEGNRLRRAMVGLGQGQTALQVVARVDDLSQGAPRPLYEIDTKATSGSQMGAAPTLALGPYGAAARFVMAGKDLERNVQDTAKEIAGQLARKLPPPR